MKTIIISLALLMIKSTVLSQCTPNMQNIHSFSINNVQYEIVKENKDWISAAECAASRGGKLAEINSQEEQDSIFYHVNQAGIVASNTIGWDGGGASYIWIGGNDIASEGNWVWNGNNDASTSPFWIGTASGSPVNGAFSNWGNEPDNWNEQDGLGFAITNWPFGVAGQWNDIFTTNELYYVIEFSGNAGLNENHRENLFSLFPNPAADEINLEIPGNKDVVVQITDLTGHILLTTTEPGRITVSTLPAGIYHVVVTSDQKTDVKFFVKE